MARVRANNASGGGGGELKDITFSTTSNSDVTIDTGLGDNLHNFYIPPQTFGNGNYTMFVCWSAGEPTKALSNGINTPNWQSGIKYYTIPAGSQSAGNYVWVKSVEHGVITLHVEDYSGFTGGTIHCYAS